MVFPSQCLWEMDGKGNCRERSSHERAWKLSTGETIGNVPIGWSGGTKAMRVNTRGTMKVALTVTMKVERREEEMYKETQYEQITVSF